MTNRSIVMKSCFILVACIFAGLLTITDATDVTDAEKEATIRILANAPLGQSSLNNLCYLDASIHGSEGEYSAQLSITSEDTTLEGNQSRAKRLDRVVRAPFSNIRLSILDLGRYGEVLVCAYMQGSRYWTFDIIGLDEQQNPTRFLAATSMSLPSVIVNYPKPNDIRIFFEAPSDNGKEELRFYRITPGQIVLDQTIPKGANTRFEIRE